MASAPLDRSSLLRRALQLSAISVALSAVTGGVAVAVALASGALSLLGFGVDAVIDATASAALIVRFRIEAQDPVRAERAEHLAERVVGAALLALAAYLVYGSLSALLGGTHPSPSVAGVVIPLIAVIVLPPIAAREVPDRRAAPEQGVARRQPADRRGRRPGAVSLLSLALSEGLGITWADAAGALLMTPILAREGWLSLRLAERG